MILAALMSERPPVETRVPIMQALLEAKGEVDATDENKSTPLLWAAQNCNLAMVKLLIQHRANVNAQARGGATPMMMAQVLGCKEVVEVLKQAGAK